MKDSIEENNTPNKYSSELDLFKIHPAQEDVYYDQLVNHLSPKNNIASYTTMKKVDRTRLQQAWYLLILSLDALRIKITADDGSPLQCIQEDKKVPLIELYDFSLDVNPDKRALHWMQQQVDIYMDHLSDELNHMSLIKLSPDNYFIFIKSHHIVIDGVGSYRLQEYIQRLYRDLEQGRSTAWLLSIPQFKDAVLRSHEYLNSVKYNKDKVYWQQFLELQQVSLLPIRYSLAKNASCTRVLSVELTDQLHHFCATYKLNLLAFFSSAVSLVMAKIIGDNEVVLNTPIHGRRGKQGMQVVGMHVNTCLFSSSIGDDSSVIEQIKTTMGSIKKSYAHCRFPRSHVQRIASHLDVLLPDVTVSYDLFKNDSDLKISYESFKVGTTYDDDPLLLSLKDYESNPSLEINASFGLQYFNQEEATLLLERLEHVLKAFIDSPCKLIQQIPLVLPHERDTLLYGFNDTDTSYSSDKTLVQSFEEQVAKTPNNTALVFEGKQLTYVELNKRANQLAHAIRQTYLDTCGYELKADTLIPLYFDRSLEMVISILAVLKAGGAYVPILPEYPAERTQFILTDTSTVLVLTQQRHLDALQAINVTLDNPVSLMVIDEWSVYADMPVANVAAMSTAKDLAYVIYTSGTTGKPKGVMIEHKALSSHIKSICVAYGISAEDKVLQFSNIGFDASVEQVFEALTTGASLYLRPETQWTSAEFILWLQDNPITITEFPPLYAKALLESVLSDVDFWQQTSLTRLIVSGDVLNADFAKAWLTGPAQPACQLINNYGPTEATISSTLYWLGESEASSSVPIGRATLDTRVYVVDEQLQLVPKGVPGELLLGGAGVARGYLNREALSAEKFIADPFSTELGARAYRSGDLVRYLSDGNLEYLGRNDSQVKLRGYRIELGEIETALSLLDSVKQAVVIDRERDGAKYLAAYVMLTKGHVLDIDSVMASLAQSLPEYMVPATFTDIDAVPLTINGKLDRRALPEPTWVNRDNYTAPRNELETQLCEIWQSVLGLERVGIHDNFFRSGGDSISAIKLVAAIRRDLGVDLALNVLFEQKTIAGIALVLNEQTLAQQELVVIPHLDMAHYPVSFAQTRMLFIEQFEQGSNAYHIPYLAQLDDDANVFLLEEAINVVSARHSVMNSVYGYDESNTAYQRVLDAHLVFQSRICHGESELLERVKADIARPFDLQGEPSLRLNHYQTELGQYVLLMWHHIAMDGWSDDIFIRELGEVYQALSESREIDLPALDINYGDYAVWQRDYLLGGVGSQQLDYWREALSGYENLSLQTDRPRPAQIDYRGQDSHFTLDAGLSSELRALAKAQETTLYTVLLSAFFVSLAKLSGQDDIVIGSPSDNRHHAQTQNLIGMFVNSLTLRAQVLGDSDITQFIQAVHDVVSQAKSHQDIPFEQLVDGLNVERDSSRHPIFQVMFGVQDFGSNSSSASQLPFTPVELEESLYSPAKFDLSLFLTSGEDNISGQINYAVSLFDEASVERISAIYTRVLQTFVAEQTQNIANIDVLSAQERNTLLHDFNDTDAPYPSDKTLHQLFDEQVSKTPDNIALVFEDKQLTYAELNVRANQLAHAIRDTYFDTTGHELKADTLIPLYLDRSLEMVISILAVLKAGGAYVPISPEYPAERTQFILTDTDAKMVVTQSQYLGTLTALGDDMSLLSADLSSSYESMPTQRPNLASTANDLAYVIYTSGTTGKPKGVMVEHDVFTYFILSAHQWLSLESFSTLSLTQYTFDIFGLEYALPLVSGDRLILSEFAQLNESLDSHLQDISFIQQTPSMWSMICDEVGRRYNLSSIQVVVGGESCSAELFDKLSALFMEIHHVYGPTETCIWSTRSGYQDGNDKKIGRPLSSERIYVLDDKKKLLLIGGAGELYIGGAGLARGYLNQPELTAASFIDNPFATAEDIAKGYTRLYKTGDLVRYLPDGNLEYLGRNDSQIKIRGYRIELGEIETALSLLDSVKQAVVIDRERDGAKYLAAYVMLTKGHVLDIDSVMASLAQSLPEYMVPATFTDIDAVPLTINGKLDRRALPEPTWVNRDNYTAPRNELETQLCEIWQSVLGLERVGVYDNFFRTGGDSISAIKLVGGIRRDLGVDLALHVLFEQKTVAGIVLALNEQSLSQQELVVIPHCDMAHYPVSFAQARMLFIEQFEQGSNAYHMPYLAQLDDDINVLLLEEAINVVSGRHVVMNSVYGYDESNNAYQQVLDTRLTLNSYTCHGEAELSKMIKADIARPFDLQGEPSLRLNHYQTELGQYVLLMWHHIAMDGWSEGIFIRELSEVYQGLSESREINLPALDINYGDYAVWQRDYLQGDVGERQLDYWRMALSGCETLTLPTDRPRPVKIDYRGQDSEFTLDVMLSNKLRMLAREQETTLYTVLLSAFYVSLAKLSGQDDIVIGSPSDNRHHAQTQSLIGMFVNSLALRAQVLSDLDTNEFIQAVHDVVSQAKSHQDIPFEQLVDGLNVERDSSRHPIFQVMFGVQDFGSNSSSASQLPFTPVELEESLYSPAKFDLSLFLTSGEDNISGQINYAVSLFDEASVERISAIYTRVLQTFVAEQTQNIANIDVLSAQERNTLLHDFNDTDAPYPSDKTLHQLFDEQVSKTPDNIALVFEDKQLTYAELNVRANQLAHAIRDTYFDTTGHELKADTLIPLYLDRSLEMVISILAVLKAGGAYVPISPEYPAERTQFILTDTDAKMVVTQSQYLGTLTALGDDMSLLSADLSSSYESMPTQRPNLASTANDLAYVIYTSGTTGKPKGVMTPHQGITSLVHNNAYIDLSADDALLQLSDTSFDAATFELWGALTYGAKLVLPTRNAHISVEQIRHLLRTHKISVLWLTRALFDSLYVQDMELFANLRYLLVGGEALTPDLIRQLLAQESRPEKVLNGYGPTESTTFTTTYDCDHFGGSVPIGKPINTRKVYVLDSDRKLSPLGVSGELYIGGAGLARGYLNRPDLTAASFIKNPFATAEDIEKGYTRLYKTGDLVRYLADGHLEYLGRNDSQVKIRGYRIELGEIGTALSLLDSVKQAVVIDRERDGAKYLAAYVMLTKGHVLDIDSVMASLAQSLPEYMVPATFTDIDAVPLTINGKLDRRALPEPTWVNRDNYTAPRNELETRLCEIWQSVLGLERVGIHDNFFRSGGDSIISIQLVSKLRQAGFSLQVKVIFDAPTVAQLASALEKEASAVEIVAEQGVLEGEFDLLPIQQWFFDGVWASEHHWNQAFMVQLPQGVTLSAIERALESLAEQHDVLRTRFTSSPSRGQRYDARSAMAPLVSCDVSELSDDELHQQLTTWQSDFALDAGPLWQAAELTGYEDGRSRLFFALHHLIIDAVSWRIIADDMRLLLTGQSLPEKTSSYRQWVGAITEYGKKSEKDVAYWQGVTADMRILPELSEPQTQGVMLSHELTETLLREANSGYHTEINDLLLSALTIALQSTFGESVNHIVLEGHGRESIDETLDVSQTVGWFTSMYPVKLDAYETAAETIIHTKEMLRAIPDKGLGYGALRQVGRVAGQLPRVSFNYLGQLGVSSVSGAELDWSLVGGDTGVEVALNNEGELALNINGAVQQGVLGFSIISRLSQAKTALFVADFEAALDAVINTAKQQAQLGGLKTPSDYGVDKLSNQQLHQLTDRFNTKTQKKPSSVKQTILEI
ncbi:amino acid adenylation domain-containing protein [Shewanella sp. VB17]|uniref:non-ribosomal peptide synthetase n=1 Tax=Shewanella sp. VB17 TaxID=2739432 RepID=UPI00156533CC|nr:non-ribosomal peptide synthetase [Shewanella sp. VB17]NRD71669.1 amino acid adenylation domain-containing protein [Shewanella sp. VB17]